ncbi:MAG: hypothetical protein LBR22_11145 [Desulfovibrio sp.]|nr:hypothetical protein [Desulfovibrio sp.]
MKNIILPSPEEQCALLDAMEDEDIDLSDIPEVQDTSGWVRGSPLRAIREKTMRIKLAPDVFAWLKDHYDNLDEAVNTILLHASLKLRHGQVQLS